VEGLKDENKLACFRSSSSPLHLFGEHVLNSCIIFLVFHGKIFLLSNPQLIVGKQLSALVCVGLRLIRKKLQVKKSRIVAAAPPISMR
jgi:hypothetical protein